MAKISTRADELAERRLLNAPLSLHRLRDRPRWLIDDLAPTRWELRHPLRFLRALRLWHRIRQEGFTMLGCRRGRYLYQLAADLDDRGITGVIADCGAWNGGSTALMAAGSPGRGVWAFDSFEGLPGPGDVDTDAAADWQGECLGAEKNLQEVMRRYAPTAELTVVSGWFDDTFPAAAAEIPAIALLHADGDWYESVRTTLEHFYEKLSPGGVIAVDDYGVWRGARMATDEFRDRNAVKSPLMYRESGVWWIKDS